MNTKDTNRYRMITSVRATLADHEKNNSWTKIPALVQVVDELDTITAGIALHLGVTASPSGAAVSKKGALSALVGSAHEVAAAVHAWATAEEDENLAAEVDFSPTDLAKGRDAKIVARCKNIAAHASDNLDALADYNLTQAKVTALSKKIEAFDTLSTQPRQRVAKKAAANQALPRLLNQGRNLLTRRMDRLMVPFRTTEPELYAEYQTARKIVDSRATLGNRKANNIVEANTTPAEVLKAA